MACTFLICNFRPNVNISGTECMVYCKGQDNTEHELQSCYSQISDLASFTKLREHPVIEIVSHLQRNNENDSNNDICICIEMYTFRLIAMLICYDFRLCQVCMVTDEALIAETAVWPNFSLMNIFFALKGSKLFIIIYINFDFDSLL